MLVYMLIELLLYTISISKCFGRNLDSDEVIINQGVLKGLNNSSCCEVFMKWKTHNWKFLIIWIILALKQVSLFSAQNFNIQTCFSQFLWFFSLKCWFKGQIICRIHLSLPNAYKQTCFDRYIMKIGILNLWSVFNCLCNVAWNFNSNYFSWPEKQKRALPLIFNDFLSGETWARQAK